MIELPVRLYSRIHSMAFTFATQCRHNKVHLSKRQNIFVHNLECICPKYRMYLYKIWNVFIEWQLHSRRLQAYQCVNASLMDNFDQVFFSFGRSVFVIQCILYHVSNIPYSNAVYPIYIFCVTESSKCLHQYKSLCTTTFYHLVSPHVLFILLLCF